MAPWKLICALTSLGVVSVCAPLQASTAQHIFIERPAPVRPELARPGFGRPMLGGKPTQQFVSGIAAIVAAQIAAKEQADTGKINVFSKPRPRPDREHILFKRPVGPSFVR